MRSKFKFAVGLITATAAIVLIFALSLKESTVVQNSLQTQPTQDAVPAQQVTDGNPQSGSVEFSPEAHPAPEQGITRDNPPAQDWSSGGALDVESLRLLGSLPFDNVRQVLFDNDRALFATAGGVIEFYPDDSAFAIYSHPQGLDHYDTYAVLAKGNDLFVGTEAGVYRIDYTGYAHPVWKEIADTVSVLKSFDDFIYIGTRQHGLYAASGDDVQRVIADRHIIDVTADSFALWVATSEDGLIYRVDGGWRKRYLLSDSAAFHGTSALLSAFGRTWVGTDHGLYEYNGDNWNLIDTTDHLFDPCVTSLAAGRSYLYLGTETKGVFAYRSGSLSPLDWSDDLPVRSLAIRDGRYLLALKTGGALLKSRDEVLDVVAYLRKTQQVFSAVGESAESR